MQCPCNSINSILHISHFICFSLKLIHVFLAVEMMLYELMTWWLRILLTFLDWGGSGELYYHFIQQCWLEVIHYVVWFFPQSETSKPSSLCAEFSRLTFSDTFSLSSGGTNFSQRIQPLLQGSERGGFIAFHKSTLPGVNCGHFRTLSTSPQHSPPLSDAGPWFTSLSSSDSYSSTLKLSSCELRLNFKFQGIHLKQNPALATWKLTHTSIMVQI